MITFVIMIHFNGRAQPLVLNFVDRTSLFCYISPSQVCGQQVQHSNISQYLISWMSEISGAITVGTPVVALYLHRGLHSPMVQP